MKIAIELTGILEQAVIAVAGETDPTEYFTARCYDLAAKYARQQGIKAADDVKALAVATVDASIGAALPVKIVVEKEII